MVIDKFECMEQYINIFRLNKKIHEIAKTKKEKLKEIKTKKKMEKSIISKKEEIDILYTFISHLKYKDMKLIYKATRDGFSTQDFHQKCAKKEKVLVLFKSQNCFLFGGYNPVCWNNGTSGWINCENSFIFSLSNPLNKPCKLECFVKRNSIFDRPSYGPTFGRDICIKGHSNIYNSCYSILGSNYECKLFFFFFILILIFLILIYFLFFSF